MKGHHLILGKRVDYLTGRSIVDTHDERYRQKIARLLVEDKGFRKSDIRAGQSIEIQAGGKCARVPVSFTVSLDGRTAMLVHYGPGSLTTRHRPALALARLTAPYEIPLVVVTNGEAADILDGATGRRLAEGLTRIPHRSAVELRLAHHAWQSLDRRRTEIEARILMAYEVDDRCPCDTDVCKRPVAT